MEERAGSDSFRPGEWDDRKVRHSFIQKVRTGLGLRGGLGLGRHSHVRVLAAYLCTVLRGDSPLHYSHGLGPEADHINQLGT